MLHLLLEYLANDWSALRAWGGSETTGLRAALAALTSFVLAIALGPWCIRWLKSRFREPIKTASPQLERLHANKLATPTMGGLFLIAGVVVTTLLWGDWQNSYLTIAVFMALGLAALGAGDDWIKLRTARRGLSARAKFGGQLLVCSIAAVLIYRLKAGEAGGLELWLPFARQPGQLGLWFLPLATLTMVGTSNAVNLTDGLDGLAGGCLICVTAAMGLVVYVAGDAEWAAFLRITYCQGSAEMLVLAGAMLGVLAGFLWFNCHPAAVFMGDTGSLPLGGLLGLLAVVARQELLLLAIGGIFVIETASVVLQVLGYRSTGRRLFRCAPLHHHFQLLGWSEDKIVVRFWIAAAVCAGAGLLALPQGRRPAQFRETSPRLTQTSTQAATWDTFPR